MPRRRIDKLSVLGITEDDFQQYLTIFCNSIPGSPYVSGQHWQKHLDSRNWICVKNRQHKIIPLVESTVLRHLLGEFWISRSMALRSDYFCIDIDRRRVSAMAFREAFSATCKALPHPLIFQSSKSKGLHLYYFLRTTETLDNIAKWLKSIFETHSIKLSPGVIESFPGNVNHLRLPLGRYSCLVNNSLQPLHLSLKETIEFSRRHKSAHLLNIDEFMLSANSKKSDSIKRYPADEERSSATPYGDYLAKEPPIPYGGRNDAMLRYVQKGLRIAGPNEDVNEILKRHISDLRHGSKDIKSDLESELKRVDYMFDNWRGKIQSTSLYARERMEIVLKSIQGKRLLGENDILFIANATEQLKKKDRYGYEAFLVQQFMANIISYYRHHQRDTLPLPTNTLMMLRGGTKHTLPARIQYCIDQGLLIITRESNYHLNQCREYRFGLSLEGKNQFNSFEDGIRTLWDKTKLFRMFSRGVYNSLTRRPSETV